jgi:hypothetical protein
VVEGQVPAMLPDLFVKYQKSKRRIRATIVTSSVRNNSKCIVILPSRTGSTCRSNRPQAPLLWILSSFVISCFVYGSHMIDPYSIIDLTNPEDSKCGTGFFTGVIYMYTDIWLFSFSLMLRACWRSKNTTFTVFGLTYHIVLKNDTLFVPSVQSPRSECHSFK